jgi:hypothetical protein
LKLRGSEIIEIWAICAERKDVMGRSESRFRNWKKATSKTYRTVLFSLQNRYLFKRIAPTVKRSAGIDEATISIAAALNLSKPAGTRSTEGAYREKKIDAKKRKIRYGL